MPKTQRPLSPYAADAVALLGQLIRKARIERKLKAVDVTDRAGISRGLLRRIETGDPGCTIGAVFEVAAIVGVRLFDTDQTSLSRAVETNREIMARQPSALGASAGRGPGSRAPSRKASRPSGFDPSRDHESLAGGTRLRAPPSFHSGVVITVPLRVPS